MSARERFREAVVVSQEPFRPNVPLIGKILTEMGLQVESVSQQAPQESSGPVPSISTPPNPKP